MKVIGKQFNSTNCIICGMQNELGLKAPFYVLEDNRVLSEFQYTKFHQSYPERVHGGMITCMLDEIAGR
ncbi:MAG: PaaI family thioesterase, partial [Clostridia bacterium]